MKKVVSKGYTITVVSWENDGDNYNTKSITVDTLKEAKLIHKLCTTVFTSRNNSFYKGIGNLMEDNHEKVKDIIVPFMKEHPELYENDKDNIKDDDDLAYYCMDVYNEPLLGCSQYYYSRVCESCTVTYSAEDIFVEKIIF